MKHWDVLSPIFIQHGAIYGHKKHTVCRGPSNDHSWAVADRKFKMAATAGHRLTLDPMGKYSNAFFSETTNMIKAKLYMNVH
jgi:hypothetical protein